MSRFSTRVVRPPRVDEDATRASSPPIYQTATFAQQLDGEDRWDYSRSGNPTRAALEAKLAELDSAERSLAYTSGIAAINALFGLVKPGERIVVSDDLYGGTQRLLAEKEAQLDIEVVRVDSSDGEQLAAALNRPTALCLIETPSNPRLRETDLAAAAHAAHRSGGLLAVDNSMSSPYLLRPLERGADLALQSATKLLGGHADLTAGVISVADPAVGERLAFLQNAEGTALAPFESWLLLRGLQTLGVRLDRQRDTRRRIEEFLRDQPGITRLHQARRTPGVLIAFETGNEERSRRLLRRLRLFATTVSFGSVCSTASLPAAMSHASIPPGTKASSRPPPDLVRLSVGLEDPADLIEDLAWAFASLPDRAPAGHEDLAAS